MFIVALNILHPTYCFDFPLCFRFSLTLQHEVFKITSSSFPVSSKQLSTILSFEAQSLEPQELSKLTPMFIIFFDKLASGGTSDTPFLTIYFLAPIAAFFILPSAIS